MDKSGVECIAADTSRDKIVYIWSKRLLLGELKRVWTAANVVGLFLLRVKGNERFENCLEGHDVSTTNAFKCLARKRFDMPLIIHQRFGKRRGWLMMM